MFKCDYLNENPIKGLLLSRGNFFHISPTGRKILGSIENTISNFGENYF